MRELTKDETAQLVDIVGDFIKSEESERDLHEGLMILQTATHRYHDYQPRLGSPSSRVHRGLKASEAEQMYKALFDVSSAHVELRALWSRLLVPLKLVLIALAMTATPAAAQVQPGDLLQVPCVGDVLALFPVAEVHRVDGAPYRYVFGAEGFANRTTVTIHSDSVSVVVEPQQPEMPERVKATLMLRPPAVVTSGEGLIEALCAAAVGPNGSVERQRFLAEAVEEQLAEWVDSAEEERR